MACMFCVPMMIIKNEFCFLIALFATCLETIILGCFLLSSKETRIVCSRQQNTITVIYTLVNGQKIEYSRTLSDMIDLREDIVQVKNKKGGYRTVGHKLILIFKTEE